MILPQTLHSRRAWLSRWPDFGGLGNESEMGQSRTITHSPTRTLMRLAPGSNESAAGNQRMLSPNLQKLFLTLVSLGRWMLSGRDEHFAQGHQAGAVQPQQVHGGSARGRKADHTQAVRAPCEVIGPMHSSRMEQGCIEAGARVNGGRAVEFVSIAALACQREIRGVGGAMAAPRQDMFHREALRCNPRWRQAVLATPASPVANEAPQLSARAALRHTWGSSDRGSASVFQAWSCAARPVPPDNRAGGRPKAPTDL